MDLSIVIPLFNEVESLTELCDWIVRVVSTEGYTYEVILVDDGSDDGSWPLIQQLSKSNSNLKGIKFSRNYGKSNALDIGFKKAQGNVVITMDADLQDSPDEIPKLYAMIMDEDYDLVSGWKQKRHDPIGKTIPSKIFNGATRILSGIPLHDFNCGLKAYKKKLVKMLEVQGEMHRYIPVMAKRMGFDKIGELVVQHQARKYGYTKFGLERFVNGFLDLMTIQFISRFGNRPMHLFGTIGTLSFLAGGMVAIWLIVQKLLAVSRGTEWRDVTDQPLFYLALVAIIVGVQLFLAGFLGELLSRSNPNEQRYIVEEMSGIE